jgi:predicted HTH transcriptional regulator
MFTKSLKDIEYKDIVDLINVRKEKEGLHLDFKGEPEKFDHFANDMVKIFSSFANSNGGFIIFGVEEKDKEFTIKGILEKYGGKTVVEWINQKMIGNLEPRLLYPDPKVISLPDSTDRVLLVYYIPESTIKPHFNSGDNRYYIRGVIQIVARQFEKGLS